MNKGAIIFWGSLSILGIILSVIWINVAKSCDNVNSSPVEEMYHKQLVITLDSVLDAHLNAATLKAIKDKDSTGITNRTHYEKYFIPMEE